MSRLKLTFCTHCHDWCAGQCNPDDLTLVRATGQQGDRQGPSTYPGRERAVSGAESGMVAEAVPLESSHDEAGRC